MAAKLIATLIATMIALPAAAATQCAPGANCSQGQRDGISIGTNTGPINVTIGPPRDPRGLYQRDTKIGRSWTADIDKIRGVVVFHNLAFNAYADPSLPIEFGALALHCKDAPVEDGRRLVAELHVMIAGDVRCEIVK